MEPLWDYWRSLTASSIQIELSRQLGVEQSGVSVKHRVDIIVVADLDDLIHGASTSVACNDLANSFDQAFEITTMWAMDFLAAHLPKGVFVRIINLSRGSLGDCLAILVLDLLH